MTKARENSDYTGLAADIVAGDTAARAGRKNLIINGDMQVSQRGDYTSATTVSNGLYYIDRWQLHTSGVSSTVQDTGRKQKVTATSTATGYLIPQQQIEDLTYLQGKTVTVSAKVTSNSSNARLQVSDNATMYNSTPHTGGGGEEILILTVAIPSSATAVKVRPVIASITGNALSITSGDYIEFTNVQLELGSVATDFEHRSYGEELALCQRYYYTTIYQKRQTSIANGSYWHESLMFPTQMRTAPTCVWTTSAGNWFTVNGLYEYADGNGVRIDFRTASVSGSAYLYGSITADAEL